MIPLHMNAQTPAPAQAPAQAPAAPRIPAMPPAPGARTAAQAAQDAATAAQDAANAAQDAANAARAPGAPLGDQQLTTSTGLPVDPEGILREAQPIVGMAMVMVVAMFVGFPLVRMFARRMERRTELGAVRAQDLMPQIRQLQESVDAMAVELERISEAQRFQAKLMADRAPALPSRDQQG